MIKARLKYPTDLYGTIYIDNIQNVVVICLDIPGWTTYVVHPGIFYAGSIRNNLNQVVHTLAFA